LLSSARGRRVPALAAHAHHRQRCGIRACVWQRRRQCGAYALILRPARISEQRKHDDRRAASAGLSAGTGQVYVVTADNTVWSFGIPLVID
jgi:hypothetical protein